MVGREPPARQSVGLEPIELPLRHAYLEIGALALLDSPTVADLFAISG
jgi:hypothetical protein